jgi:hypothetical protein
MHREIEIRLPVHDPAPCGGDRVAQLPEGYDRAIREYKNGPGRLESVNLSHLSQISMPLTPDPSPPIGGEGGSHRAGDG